MSVPISIVRLPGDRLVDDKSKKVDDWEVRVFLVSDTAYSIYEITT